MENIKNLLATPISSSRVYIVYSYYGRLTDFQSTFVAPKELPVSWPIDDKPSQTFKSGDVWEEAEVVVPEELHDSLSSIHGLRGNDDTPLKWVVRPSLLQQLTRRRSEQLELDGAPMVKGASSCGLAVRLGNAARQRLYATDENQPVAIPFRIKSVEAFVYQTRLCQLVFELDVGATTPVAGEIVEMLHSLCHEYGSGGPLMRQYRHGVLDIDEEFNLRALADALVGRGKCPPSPEIVPAFSYVAASTSEALKPELLDQLTARLARRHNAHYSLSDSMAGVVVTSSFTNLSHVCGLEGGASLASSAGNVEFLSNYPTHRGSGVYLPIALLAHKEFHDLVRLSQSSTISIESSDRGNLKTIELKAAQLESLQERVLNFRLNHHKPVASFSQNHNLVLSAWREALHIEPMRKDLAEDVAEAGSYLSGLRETITADRQKKALSYLTAGASFIAGVQGAQVMTSMARALKNVPDAALSATLELIRSQGLQTVYLAPSTRWIIIESSFQLAVGLMAAFVAFNFARR
jgi:hypothetical protein